MSATHYEESDWNYRITEQRQIRIEAKDDIIRKISAIDLATNLPFSLETKDFPTDSLEVGKGYFATIKVYTLKYAGKVEQSAMEFFEALDVNQSAEDFIKAFWLYPYKIKFELVEAESLL
ncbi:MAG TPA: hypothetical protein VF893_04775 [Candidatus Bathyarchaeia archaeon]